MIATGLNSSLNSSGVSSHVSACEDNIDTTIAKNYVKNLLKSRIFLGRYLERRLVDQRIGYRDIVLVSAAEEDMKKDLLKAQIKLRAVLSEWHWIGITDAETLDVKSAGICVCTEIDNQPFGPFWFQIRTVKFRDSEVIIVLKCLRHISDEFLELEPILTGSLKSNKDSINTKITSSVDCNVTYNDIVDTLKGALSISNVRDFFSFIFVFLIAIFTGSSSFINFLGNFVLALIREFSILIKNSTPMFLGFLDFVSKIFGGFYILVAMLFKPSKPVPVNRRSITYDQQSSRPYYQNSQYNDRSFD